MPPKRAARSASRRLSPVSPAKTAPQPQPESPQTTRRGARGATRDTDALPPVTEGNEYQEVGAAPIEDEIQESAASQAASDLSSDSQGELEALSYDLILDSLPDLESESGKLLNNFHGIDVNLEAYILSLRDSNAPSTRRCAIQLKKLLATREAFGGRVWAMPSIIVRKLRNGEAWANVPDGAWRPDAILYLANLAQFVMALCLSNVGEATMMDTFSFYPLPFTPTSPEDRFTTGDIQGVLRVGDDLRTQLFLHEARKRVSEPNFDPDELLSQVFFDEFDTRTGPLAAQLGQQYNDDHQNRLKQIRSTFSKNNKNPIQFAKLEKAFSWDQFVLHTVQWAVQRQQELDTSIQAQGGADFITEAIRTGDFNTPAQANARAKPAPRSPVKHMARRGGGRGGRGGRKPNSLPKNIAALKQARANVSEPNPVPRSANQFEMDEAAAALMGAAHQIQQMESGYGPAIDDETGVPPSAQGQLSPGTQIAQQRYVQGVIDEEQQANKENYGQGQPTKSYMDPQLGATRVEWNTQDFGGPSGTKRQATVETDDSDAFEDDDRRPKRPRPNKGKARALPEPSRVFEEQNPYPHTQPTRSPLREHTRLPPSSLPANLTGLPASSQYGQVNQLAKMNVQATKERDNRHIVQQRKAYSDEEVHRLMDLIAINQGPKYAKILKDDKEHPHGPVLQGRTQVQLKDKARNIKMDYLKARQRLPDGFANVSIGKRMVENLKSIGIDYVEGDWEGVNVEPEEHDEA